MVKKEIKKKLNEMEQWFKENPKLPAEIDLLLLRRFLKCMSYEVEETKKLIELNYSIRNKNPNIYLDRDPNDESIKKVQARGDMVPLPGLTPEGNKLVFYRMIDYDASKMNSLDDCKYFYMLTDTRFITPDLDEDEKKSGDYNKVANEQNNEDDEKDGEDEDEDDEHKFANGEIQVVDFAGFSMAHVTHMSLAILRVHSKFMQEAYPVPMRAMHIINTPPFINRLLTLFKPFVNDNILGMMHFHTDSIESLYEHVPRDMLPNEYGGKAGSIAELKKKWTDKMLKKRDYLMDPNQWKVEQNENRRWFWW